ncbi:MAG: extracellular solute-binding protein [Clostridia bacterium]|nr:extracellular solute-binding protein [Clostridia bacterium]
MKHLIPIFCMLILAVILAGCRTETPGYTQHKPQYRAASESDAEDALAVSSVLSYARHTMKAPGYADFSGAERYAYTDGGYLYVPVRYPYGKDGIALAAVILQYDAAGALLAEIPVPGEAMNISIFRVLSDDRLLLYRTKREGQVKNVYLELIRTDGTLLASVKIPPSPTEAYPDLTAHGLCVTENEDGTARILLNTHEFLYYYDETLTPLAKLEMPAESVGIHRESDGVYLLGNSLPHLYRADLNTMTVVRLEDLPVLPKMKYFSEIQFGANGAMYCTYNSGVYRCASETDNGSTPLTHLMEWTDGMCTGEGTLWMIDDIYAYFLPDSTGIYPAELYRLELGVPLNTLDNRILTLVNTCGTTREWISELVGVFNEQNTGYYIKLVDLSYPTDTQNPQERLKSYVMETGTPDLVIFSSHTAQHDYVNKNLLMDLTQLASDRLIGCAQNAYADKNGRQFVLPLSMQLYTYAASSAVRTTPMTWEQLYTLAGECISSGTVLTRYTALLSLTSLCDFYDPAAQSASFDTEEYIRRYHFLESLKPDAHIYADTDTGFLSYADYKYIITGGPSDFSLIRSGNPLFVEVPLLSVKGYAAVKFMYGDTPYTLCGYPTLSGEAPGAYIRCSNLLSIFADTPYAEGCEQFLDFALSDEIQTSAYMTSLYLPVTVSALEQTLREYRYNYYDPQFFGSSYLADPQQSSPVPLSLSDSYVCVEISDEDSTVLIDFLNTCEASAGYDYTVYHIVEEELSAYTSGAKTLEEVTSLIQSRVWIYLNE